MTKKKRIIDPMYEDFTLTFNVQYTTQLFTIRSLLSSIFDDFSYRNDNGRVRAWHPLPLKHRMFGLLNRLDKVADWDTSDELASEVLKPTAEELMALANLLPMNTDREFLNALEYAEGDAIPDWDWAWFKSKDAARSVATWVSNTYIDRIEAYLKDHEAAAEKAEAEKEQRVRARKQEQIAETIKELEKAGYVVQKAPENSTKTSRKL